MDDNRFYTANLEANPPTISLKGEWTIQNAGALTQALNGLCAKLPNAVSVDPKGLLHLDSAGAWLLLDWINTCKQRKATIELSELPPSLAVMFNRVREATTFEPVPPPPKVNAIKATITHVGESVVGMIHQVYVLVLFMGQTVVTFLQSCVNPKEWRLADLSRHIEETGINAIPIIAMMSFMISIVIAYQGAYQLRQYGAEIYTIDLAAISVLREMGVLITAIMVAGRSGSAFAAEIGVMKVNEEIDALRTLGMSPFSVLVVPRMIALIITLPLLTFFADMMGLLGAAFLMSINMGISWAQFTAHLSEAIVFSTYAVGMIKAPFFAIIIALVGCLRGMQVTNSAESVGQLTTKAVVESIFLVMLADALFSIVFTQMNV